MEGTIAEIRWFAGNFAPLSWAFCQGQLLSIANNTALFSLIGTTYGGDGQVTFALPDLRTRVAVGTGQGPGLPSILLGEMAGAPSHTLLASELPQHNHSASMPAASASSTSVPSNTLAAGPASLGAGTAKGFGSANSNSAPPALANSGGSQPHNNMQPYLGMNYIICLEGIYPSRN